MGYIALFAHYNDLALAVVSGLLGYLTKETIDYIDNSFKVYKNCNYVVVSCELDAANAFNTPIRSEVIVELRLEGTGDNITAYCEYLKWGDKEVGTYIDLDSINVE